jgi:hypothetical protein
MRRRGRGERLGGEIVAGRMDEVRRIGRMGGVNGGGLLGALRAQGEL